MKSKTKPLPTVLLNNTVIMLFFAVAGVMILSYVMTENDIAVTSYKSAYIAICFFAALLFSFLNSKKTKLRPIMLIVISFAVSAILTAAPVLYAVKANPDLYFWILLIAVLASSFFGTVIGRKI